MKRATWDETADGWNLWSGGAYVAAVRRAGDAWLAYVRGRDAVGELEVTTRDATRYATFAAACAAAEAGVKAKVAA